MSKLFHILLKKKIIIKALQQGELKDIIEMAILTHHNFPKNYTPQRKKPMAKFVRYMNI